MFPGSLRNEWKYCGDFETEADARKHAEKRTQLLIGSDTVML